MAGLRGILWKSYRAMERRILPGRENPQEIYASEVCGRLGAGTNWLDLGCGHKLLPMSLPRSAELQRGMVRRCRLVCGIDGDLASLRRNSFIRNRTCGDIYHLPFVSESFDLVTANMVVEHVDDPLVLLREIGKVLCPGGVFICHTPNCTSYKILLARAFPDSLKRVIIRYLQDRSEDDVYSTNYRMNTVGDLSRAAAGGGFDMLECRMLQGPADSVMLGPLAIFELMLMRLFSRDRFRSCRSNIVSVMRKRPIPT